MANSDDYLASLSLPQLAAWYKRLANDIGQRTLLGQEPLAAVFLKKWLENKNPKATYGFTARSYLKNNKNVIATLQYHRAVFLTQQKARIGSGSSAKAVWAGILARLQKKRGYTPWTPGTPLTMDYTSLVEIGSGTMDIIRIMSTGTPEEKDLFTSLRGFQLKSDIKLNGSLQADGKLKVVFAGWHCTGYDRYDFNPNEHLTVPNPDYKASFADAVKPDLDRIRVYHTNAQRLEAGGLAAPYNIKIDQWLVNDLAIVGPATIDSKKVI